MQLSYWKEMADTSGSDWHIISLQAIPESVRGSHRATLCSSLKRSLRHLQKSTEWLFSFFRKQFWGGVVYLSNIGQKIRMNKVLPVNMLPKWICVFPIELILPASFDNYLPKAFSSANGHIVMTYQRDFCRRCVIFPWALGLFRANFCLS